MYNCKFEKRKRVNLDKNETAKRLKQLREENNYSIRDIQNYLNLESSQSVYNWEKAESKSLPKIDHAILLADLYHVHIDELIVFELIKEDITEVMENVSQYSNDAKETEVSKGNFISLEEYLENQDEE